jgi:DNA-binding MarR family transcriptional regulator
VSSGRGRVSEREMDSGFVKFFRQKVREMQRAPGWSQKNDIQCCGVTMAQCHALLEIGQMGEISIVDLAGILGVDTSTLSRTIDHMVKNGLVGRLLNPQDRRYVSLSLTKEGKAVFDTIEATFDTYFTRVFGFIPEEKHSQVMESLMLLTTALGRCSREYQCCVGTDD